jgi:hypothetical protein
MIQASSLTPGTLSETAIQKASISFCQKMIWRGQLVIPQMLGLCQNLMQSEDRVTGKVTVDHWLKIGLFVSEDIPLVSCLQGISRMKITLDTATVISLVQERDEPVLSQDHMKDEPVISLVQRLKDITPGTFQKYLILIIIILQLGMSTLQEYHMKL